MACVGDTCSINSTIDPVTGELTNDVVLAANSGLECDAGLKVVRYGDSAPVTVASMDTCHNKIGITTTNELFVQAQYVTAIEITGSTRVDIPNSGDSDNSLCFEYTNNTDCSQLVEVHIGETKTIYEVNGVGFYQLTGAARMVSSTPNIRGDSTIIARNDQAGSGVPAGTELQWSQHMLSHYIVGPTLSLNIGVDFAVGNHTNVDTAGASVGGNVGFQALKAYLVIHNVGVVGTDIVSAVPGDCPPGI